MLINDIRGRFVKKGVLEPVGVCDRSGFWFSKSDLVKEYIWAGENLVWNGLLVGRPFLDQPNEQFRTPIIKDDPQPVDDPRPAPYDPPGIDAMSNNQRQKSLNEKVHFTIEDEATTQKKPPAYVHNIMGYDSSNISSKTREEILHKVNFNRDS